ncbi:bicyclomycin resistance protein [Marinomonas sp. MED121]|uniref:multidrug effflux MFS transporter n=1 Tax=Marinomonas sp. MED121 TaxID=314277 RepID=UPI000068FD8F|nr:multidrug effflux MFS transporter [Marinomonas sp. MED121]EAQ65463.1 bicyclomycin resistance protein [Marinomonas sp. MED121]
MDHLAAESLQKPKMSAKEFTALTATLMSIVAISIDALLPALGIITQDLQIQNPNQAQLLIGALFLGMATGQLIAGPLSDALGRKPVLYAGLFIYSIGTLTCFFAPSFEVLLAGRIIQGLGAAGPYISAVSLVRDQYKGREMAKVMSLVMMIFILVPALAPSLGEMILLFTNWHGIFVMYGLYALIILTWISFRLEETLKPEQRIPFSRAGFFAGFKEVISNKSTISLTFCAGLMFGCLIGYISSAQQIFQVQFETGKLFSVYFGGLALLVGVSSLVNSKIVGRLGMHLISKRAFSVIILNSIIFLIVQSLVEVQLWMFVIFAGILFFCFGLLFGNINAMAMEPMGHVAGIAAAVIGAISSIMSNIVGTSIGQMYNNTLIPMTLAYILLCSLALALLYYAEKKTNETKQEEEGSANHA